jgi:hypothetical protein
LTAVTARKRFAFFFFGMPVPRSAGAGSECNPLRLWSSFKNHVPRQMCNNSYWSGSQASDSGIYGRARFF